MTVNDRSEVVAQVPPEVYRFFQREATQSNRRYLSRTHQQRRNLVLGIVGGELSKLKKNPAQCTALDFGCGAGVLVEDLSTMGINVTGVDPSPAMIEAAQSRFRSCVTAELELLGNYFGQGGAYRHRSYDLILCLSVLEFTVNPKEILARLSGLLAGGGLLVLTVPNRNSYLRHLERVVFRHPKFARLIPGLNHLAESDCYLHHQTYQFAAEELVLSAAPLGLDVEQRRFHVAPKLCGLMEQSEKVGMMLLLTFRKCKNIADTDAGTVSASSMAAGLPLPNSSD